MLNAELLQKQEELKELTEEQLNAIVKLSNNDAKADIEAAEKKAKGVVFGRFDDDIKNIFGIDKEGNEPTHIFLKNAVEKWKADNKGGDNADRITELETLNADLQKKIEAGQGNDAAIEAWKKKYEDVLSQNDLLKSDQDKLKSDFEAQLKEKDETYHNTLIHGALDSVLKDLKFKSEDLVSKRVRDAFIKTEKEKLLNSYKTRFVDDGNGGKMLEFLDETGEILRNPDNKREPYTALELLSKGLTDIIDTGKHQSGGGSKAGGNKGFNLDLGAAKTQVEADNIITQRLLSEGYAKTDSKFNEKHAEMRTAAEVHKLPIGG